MSMVNQACPDGSPGALGRFPTQAGSHDQPPHSLRCREDHRLPGRALCWSVFWDKRAGVWRVAEHDPGSGLYAESPDADIVIAYMSAHS